MKLIVGLGNPGQKYNKNRHNVGFMFIDKLTSLFDKNDYQTSKQGKLEYTWHTLNNQKLELIKPQTFMNDSGSAVIYAYKKHPELSSEDVFVIHDDLDLPLGEYKIQLGVGPKVHNGVNDIEEKLKSKNFYRVRIGVDNRDPENRIPGEAYVLQDFKKEELHLLEEVFIKAIKDLLEKIYE